MRAAGYAIWALAQMYLLVLMVRLVLSWVMSFSRTWRPQKTAAALAEVVFMVTDPPLRLVRKVVKPVRVGPVALDLAFLVVVVAVSMVAYAAAALSAAGT
ncbi:MAG: YggT family protein [Bifidobacteriaceae bacterium]|nr:YggT family protein [Bifidobacteriaceae bacterium]